MLFLLQATGFDRPSVVKLLLDLGADPNIGINKVDTPLSRGINHVIHSLGTLLKLFYYFGSNRL